MPKTIPGHATGAGEKVDLESVSTKDLFSDSFLKQQKNALLRERELYVARIEALQEEAEQMAEEAEPGDTQFDEESGEGASSNVDREYNLRLITQAHQTLDDIDRALGKLERGVYGLCEKSGKPISEARLEAIPWATLSVEYANGGLTRR